MHFLLTLCVIAVVPPSRPPLLRNVSHLPHGSSSTDCTSWFCKLYSEMVLYHASRLISKLGLAEPLNVGIQLLCQQIPATSNCCCSVTQLCLTLCNPMDCSTPGLPVPHHLPSLPKFMSTASVMPSSHLIL